MRKSKRLPLEELSPYLLEHPEPPVPRAWEEVFGNGRPAEIEIGFGKGLFLLTAAQACPSVNFLGIEIARKYQLFTATRLAKRGLKNVRLTLADARLFLRDGVPPASVQALHVYFPDPWWKKRHLKRRLFTPEFVQECVRVLWPAGRLHVVTDVHDYFDAIQEIVAQHPGLRPLPPPDLKLPRDDLDYLTNFERKFRKQGREIYRGVWERCRP